MSKSHYEYPFNQDIAIEEAKLDEFRKAIENIYEILNSYKPLITVEGNKKIIDPASLFSKLPDSKINCDFTKTDFNNALKGCRTILDLTEIDLTKKKDYCNSNDTKMKNSMDHIVYTIQKLENKFKPSHREYFRYFLNKLLSSFLSKESLSVQKVKKYKKLNKTEGKIFKFFETPQKKESLYAPSEYKAFIIQTPKPEA